MRSLFEARAPKDVDLGATLLNNVVDVVVNNTPPIIFLTALADESTLLKGFNLRTARSAYSHFLWYVHQLHIPQFFLAHAREIVCKVEKSPLRARQILSPIKQNEEIL